MSVFFKRMILIGFLAGTSAGTYGQGYQVVWLSQVIPYTPCHTPGCTYTAEVDGRERMSKYLDESITLDCEITAVWQQNDTGRNLRPEIPH